MRVKMLFAVAVLTYVAVCLGVYVFQSHLIYFPTHEYAYTPDDLRLGYEEVALQTEDGLSIAAWFVPAAQDKGSVIFFHGNAGNMGDRIYTLQGLHDLGYNTLIIDYRGYGGSEGRPSETGTYRDAEAAWNYLTESRGESPGRIVLMGRSLGGAVAIELATRHQPAALVVESTFTSLVDVGRVHYRFLPVSLITRHRYESAQKVPTITCPKLFLHGKDDPLIPIELSRRLYEAAAEPKQFIETPGDHNSSGFLYDDEYTQQLARFLDDAMGREPG